MPIYNEKEQFEDGKIQNVQFEEKRETVVEIYFIKQESIFFDISQTQFLLPLLLSTPNLSPFSRFFPFQQRSVLEEKITKLESQEQEIG